MEKRTIDTSWLQLWRRQRTAPPGDRWKWSWETWRHVAEKLMEGPIDDQPCPVCGERTLRYYFIVVRKRPHAGKERYIADGWIGCDSCQVQSRGRGLLPEWIDPESVERAGAFRERRGVGA